MIYTTIYAILSMSQGTGADQGGAKERKVRPEGDTETEAWNKEPAVMPTGTSPATKYQEEKKMLYEISFKKNGVCQARLMEAPDKETAAAYFTEEEPTATLYGVSSYEGTIRPGMPLDHVPEGWKPAPAVQACPICGMPYDASNPAECGTCILDENKIRCCEICDGGTYTTRDDEDVTGCTLSELEAKCHELRELQRLIEEAQAEAETIKDEIKAHMGEREELFAGEYKITWKHVTSARLDGKALKAALPEVAERFTRETTTRRFSVA